MRAMLGLALFFAAPAHAEALVRDSGRVVAVTCAGQDAVVRGSGNRITFTGPCHSLRVAGDANVVELALAPGAAVSVTGDTNAVYYAPAAPPPLTTLRGYYNDVRPGPAPAAPVALLLDGRDGHRDVRCDGRDVTIAESQARYVLRGGCRSLTVTGERDSVAAELLPSARIVVGGAGVAVNYVLVGDGPPPSVSVTSAALQATHLSRTGETSLRLPTQ